MRQHMERLQAGWVCEVSCVGVGGQSDIGVGGVRLGHIRHEVVETAVVGFSDWSNSLQEPLGVAGVVKRSSVHEYKAVSHLW